MCVMCLCVLKDITKYNCLTSKSYTVVLITMTTCIQIQQKCTTRAYKYLKSHAVSLNFALRGRGNFQAPFRFFAQTATTLEKQEKFRTANMAMTMYCMEVSVC